MRVFSKLTHRLHPSTVLFVFCVALIFSDIVALIFKPVIFNNYLWLILAIVFLLVVLLVPRVFMLVFVISASFLIITVRSAPDFLAAEQFDNLSGKTVTISGRIAKDPTESTNGDKFNLNLVDLKLFSQTAQVDTENPVEYVNLSGTLFVQLSAIKISDSFTVQRSDTVTITGQISASENSVQPTVLRPTVNSVERPEPGDVFLRIRNFFADKIRTYIKSPESGLALGYLLGQKSSVDQTFQSALRVIGLTHIIVASGAHLSILTNIAKKLFKKFSRFASFLAAALLTVFFISITGLSASMMRAGLVAILSLITKYFGRRIGPFRLIVLVAAATLIYNPTYLADLAWLLSFASFTGILVFAPVITKFFYSKSKQPNFIFKTLISSLAATILCMPILLYFFGQVSLISIIANLLILPTVSVAMGLTFVTGIMAMICSPLANLFGYITTFILDYQIAIVNFFSEQKIFLIEIDPENPVVFVLYIPLVVVIIVVACYARFKLRRGARLLAHNSPSA